MMAAHMQQTWHLSYNIDSKELPRPARGLKINAAELKMTPDRGIGVFATENIQKGTLIYSPHGVVSCHSEEETRKFLATLPDYDARKWWLEHASGLNGAVHLSSCDSVLINHSNTPSVAWDRRDGSAYSSRDIKKGEELTEDYRVYDDIPFYWKLCDEYGIDFSYIKDD